MIYLSIIVPVRNEEKFIAETLRALSQQDYPHDRFEILVVDGQSTDRTQEVVGKFIKLHPDLKISLLENPGILSSRARNIGVKAAQGQLIAVIDGHVYIPTDKLFASMELAATKNNALCLSRPAPLDVPTIKDGLSFWIAIARKTWLGHSSKSFIYNDYRGFVDPMSAGFAYDATVFKTVGYFDESFDAAEDVEFHYRLKEANIMSFISPDLLIYSYPRDSFQGLFRQQVRYGEGRAKLSLKHPNAFTKETLIPIGISCLTLLYPISFVLPKGLKFFSTPVVSLMSAYLIILLFTGFRESLSRGKFFQGFLVALAIWTTHFGLGYGLSKQMILNFLKRP